MCIRDRSYGGAYGTGTQELASRLYVQSRGMNLIANGAGLLGNNYNFTDFSFDQTDTHGGKGSFKNTTYSAGAFSDELMPVDGTKTYRLSLWAKSTTHQTGAHAYFGVATYDIDGLFIESQDYMRYPNTDTTLASQLNPGDTTITLTNGTGWASNSGNAYQLSLIHI